MLHERSFKSYLSYAVTRILISSTATASSRSAISLRRQLAALRCAVSSNARLSQASRMERMYICISFRYDLVKGSVHHELVRVTNSGREK